ncbi:MAG: nicotinate-nucleotide--dimethylbenzimidazole phosphoribosyltransferase, partial [Anaerolineales bacterium]
MMRETEALRLLLGSLTVSSFITIKSYGGTMLKGIVTRIQGLDEGAMAAARARQDTLTKPPGSLGRLEELSVQLAGITGKAIPTIKDKVIIT